MAVAHEDKKEIHAFADAIRKFSKFEIPASKAMEIMPFGEKISFFLKTISMFTAFAKWKMLVSRYAEKFKSQAIRKLLTTAYDKDTPMLIVLMNQSWFNIRDAGYPAEGAQELASRMEKGSKLKVFRKIYKFLSYFCVPWQKVERNNTLA